jgi:site-specific recombinase XerD
MNNNDNKTLIKEFELSLKSDGLAKKTMRRHIQNIELFVIDYMDVEEIEFSRWSDEIDEFFDWALRKNVIFSQSSLQQYTSSIKKFFKFLFDTGKIDLKTSKRVNLIIKDGMPDWKDSVAVQGDMFLDQW